MSRRKPQPPNRPKEVVIRYRRVPGGVVSYPVIVDASRPPATLVDRYGRVYTSALTSNSTAPWRAKAKGS